MNCATPPHLDPSQAQVTASVKIFKENAKERLIDVHARTRLKLSLSSLGIDGYCLYQLFFQAQIGLFNHLSTDTQDLDAPAQD
jgi:hypothetical protein